MTVWLINHNQEVGLLVAGWFSGVVFAAWRQIRLEEA